MTRTIIVSAFMTIFLSAVTASAQIPRGDTITFATTVDAASQAETNTIKFYAPAERNFVLYEVTPRARTEAECFAATDFSSAVLVSPDRATISYSPSTATWNLKNSNSPGNFAGCRVILAR